MPQAGYAPWGAPVPGGRLAGMGARFGGLLLDTLILLVPVIVIGVIGGAFTTHTYTCTAYNCNAGANFSVALWLDAISFALNIAYYTYFVGVQGRTPGHRVVGIKVVDVNTGGLIGPGRAALRWFVLGLTGALCTLGYWSPFFDAQRRQGWHDKAASSVVVPADAPTPA